jgi:Dna[CI] antecedent DciA-like protein
MKSSRRRRQSLAPESLEAILLRAGENRFARLRPPIENRVWRDAVGGRIADKAKPVSLSGGVLLLRVSTSVWAHELSLLADEVTSRLRERGVDVQQLRFQVGAVPAVERPPERRTSKLVPPPSPLPAEVARGLSQVDDPNLRAAIMRAAMSNLAWQEATRPPPARAPSEAQAAARAPRAAEEETAPQGRTQPASHGVSPDTRATKPHRSR